MKKVYPILFTTCLFFMAFQCDENPVSVKETEQKTLNVSRKAIEDFAAASVCNENTVCKYIALGSKPCGGPWHYLIYSTSIDVEKLENMVEIYNKNETEFNKKWGVSSDCAFLAPPASVNCENNKCIAVY